MIFDTHAHYCDSQFDIDRDKLLKSFNEKGIKYVTEVCANINDCEKIINLTNSYDFIYGALGVHPTELENLTISDMDKLRNYSKLDKIVAIGEIGLDYHYENDADTKRLQMEWFSRQLDLARECHLPVIIHSREACKDTIDIMKQHKAEEIGGVVHCYSYSVEAARDFLNFDFYFGIGGVVTYKNGQKLKDVVKMLPLNRIILETDCPYLSPTPHRGKRNSSLNLPYVVEEIAGLKNITVEEVMNATMDNALNLYRINK